MLDTALHQAAGLSVLGADNTPRIAAVVSHGEPGSEQVLLWQLCLAWVALGYQVVVLDATQQESESCPGLLQLLTDDVDLSGLPREGGRGRDADAALGPSGAYGEPQDRPIIPAAQGLRALRQIDSGMTGADSLMTASAARARELARIFHGYELVVLYANAHELALTLPASSLAPLLPVAAQQADTLTAYHALKQLLNLGQLRPTIITVMDVSAAPTAVTSPSTGLATGVAGQTLQRCARQFLAHDLPALVVGPDREAEINALALRTLDNAMPASCAIRPTGQAEARIERSLG